MKKRVLFIAEFATTAHVVRAWKMMSTLFNTDYELFFASQTLFDNLKVETDRWTFIKLEQHFTPADFNRALFFCKLPHNTENIQASLEEDLKIISDIKPDLVVGDFRLSLAMSTQIAKVPFMNLTNITWSPFAKVTGVLADNIMVRLFGATIVKFILKTLGQKAFAGVLKPFNQVASQNGVSKFTNLYDLYTYGTYVAFMDMKELVETTTLPRNQRLIGPLKFSMNSLSNEMQNRFSKKLPWVYVSLGSSGNFKILKSILTGLSRLQVNVFVSTAGKKDLDLSQWENTGHFYFSDYLPTNELLRHCQICITSGGSPLTYAAMEEGVPVLCLPVNMDHFNVSNAVTKLGVAITIPSFQITSTKVMKAVQMLLENKRFTRNALRYKDVLATYDSDLSFLQFVFDILSPEKTATNPTLDATQVN